MTLDREQRRALHRRLCEAAKSASDAYLEGARHVSREEFNRLEREFNAAMKALREFLEEDMDARAVEHGEVARGENPSEHPAP